MTEPALPVHIGRDSREDAAYRVCRVSRERRASRPLHIAPLRRKALRALELYERAAAA